MYNPLLKEEKNIKKYIDIPKEVIVELITNIPKEELEEILEKATIKRQKNKLKIIQPKDFDPIIGMINLGGNALEDTERFYE